MAYYSRQPYVNAPSPDIHLKPVANHAAASVRSSVSDDYYSPVPQYLPAAGADHARLDSADQRLKKRIRLLRMVTRILSTIAAAATLAPLTMTLVKFFQTRNIQYTVGGKQRTAWAADTQTWYTFLYFGVALVSFLINSVVVLAYYRGVKAANAADNATGWWSNLLNATHVVVWIVSAIIYRVGKEPVNGKFRDLWGWTCSTAASELQVVVTSVNFDQYCTIQTSSWYSGIANVVMNLITGAIYVMMLLRLRSKRKLKKPARSGHRADDASEPLRR
ncbi:hypothetical protein LTR53_001689 [Teratosphaeriaceae sp. CCFEE 6253]|nr:hypothetical protein LTR53_001689 [Teratosphaeriaceae sp. CCFEE 6253]